MFVFNSCSSNINGNDQAISFPDHSFLHFPSPFDDDAAAPLLLQQTQHDIVFHQIPFSEPPSTTFVNALGSESTRLVITDHHDDHHVHQNLIIMKQQQQQRQQMRSASSKRDRHSKINTLRGPRDRRMRLSLPVAREFFGLQDLLGVDKASKTVEWLLLQARHAIKKLSTDQQSCGRDDNGDTRSTPSSVSDGEEVVSGIIIDETTTTNINTKDEGRIKMTTKKKEKVRSGRVARKTAFHPLARECREKARARARARTREKQLQTRQKMLLPSSSDANPIIMGEQIEGRKQMENEEEIITQTDDQQLRRRNNQEIIIDDGDDHDCLMIMGGRWSPSNSIYNSLQNNNNGSPQEHPFGDFQFLGKLPWEPYNNHGIC